MFADPTQVPSNPTADYMRKRMMMRQAELEKRKEAGLPVGRPQGAPPFNPNGGSPNNPRPTLSATAAPRGRPQIEAPMPPNTRPQVPQPGPPTRPQAPMLSAMAPQPMPGDTPASMGYSLSGGQLGAPAISDPLDYAGGADLGTIAAMLQAQRGGMPGRIMPRRMVGV